MLEYLWMGLGAVMFILRIYMLEFPLRDFFKYEKFYLSRYVNLIFWIFMAMQFNSDILKVCILISFPSFLFSIIYVDFPALNTMFSDKSAQYNGKTKFWIILERVTLHFPLVIYFWIEILTHPESIFIDLTIFESIAGFLINFGFYFIFEPRKPWKTVNFCPKWEQYAILISNSLSAIVLVIISIIITTTGF